MFFRYALFVLALSALFACHNPVQQHNIVPKRDTVADRAARMKHTQDSLAMVALKQQNERTKESEAKHEVAGMEDTTIIPKRINYNICAFHPVTLPEPFSGNKALKALFPGHYYHFHFSDYPDSSTFEAWSCPKCTRHKFQGWGDDPGEYERFPLRDSNETQIGTILKMKDGTGKRHIIMSFGTTEFQVDFIGAGRTSGVFMGLALFTEDSNQWVLKAFNPSVGYYGMFEHLPVLSPFMFSKNQCGCYIGDMIQYAGGPDEIEGYMFAPVDTTFKIVLLRPKVSRGNTPYNNWDCMMTPDTTKESGFADIVFTTKGDYLRAGFNDYGGDPSQVLDALKEVIKHKDNFDFTVTSRYTFANGTYSLASEDVVTEKHKHTKREKNFKAAW